MREAGYPTFPMQRVCPFDPSPGFQKARDQGRFIKIKMWNGELAWLATNYDDVQQILISPSFSQEPLRSGYPFPTKTRATMLMTERPAMNQLDPPSHTKYRRLFARLFAAARMEKMRPRVQAIVDELLAAMLAKGSSGDLYTEFALAVPSRVMAEILGMPLEDQAFFQEMARTRFTYDDDNFEEPLAAGKKVCAYLEDLFIKKEATVTEGDDVISRLITEQIRPGHITRDEAIVHIRQVILASHDTTANMIALGTLLLLTHPDQLELLKSDPSLAGGAVEEMLRYLTIAQFNSSRVASEDVEIGGQLIKQGEGVIASIAAANRDPEMFDEPDKFDIRRDASRHMAFADGIHQCIGQPVARLELQVVFARLFQLMPNLKLGVDLDKIQFTGNSTAVYGLISLPVTW